MGFVEITEFSLSSGRDWSSTTHNGVWPVKLSSTIRLGKKKMSLCLVSQKYIQKCTPTSYIQVYYEQCTAYSNCCMCLAAENLRGAWQVLQGAVKIAERMVVIAVNAEVL